MTKTSGQLEIERRRQNSLIIITDPTTCYYCQSTGLKENEKYCPNCAFPQGGTQAEMKKFKWNIHNKKKLLEEQKNEIKKAKYILFILAAFYFLYGIMEGLVMRVDIAVLIVSYMCAGIYFGLGLWSRIQPFPAILSGLFVYIVFVVISAIYDPYSLYEGVLWKFIIISGFIYGYKGAKESKFLATELESIKKAKDLNIEN
jgi:ribosomal protein L37E